MGILVKLRRGNRAVREKIRTTLSPDLIIGLALYGGLGLAVTLLITGRELDFQASVAQRYDAGIRGLTWNLDLNNLAMYLVIIAVSVLLVAHVVIGKSLLRNQVLHRRLVSAVLVFFVVTSGLLYLYAARGLAQRTFVKAHDSYHYLLGPKYYDELGYFGLYEATLAADAESETPLFRDQDTVRDLSDYNMVGVGQVRQRGAGWKERFTPDRWQVFKDDLEFYKTISGDNFRLILKDRGYNGTPFHSFLAGTIANRWALNYRNATLMCLFDILGILVMMVIISWAFGWKVGALFAIFFFTSFTDRHYYIGGSFMRYYWMIGLGIGVALLKKRAYFLSAFFIAAAAMLNVFPILFLLGAGVKGGYHFIRKKGLPRRYRSFVYGVLAATVVLGIFSIAHADGVHNYGSFFSNIANQTELATRSRIGFRYLFILPVELSTAFNGYDYVQKAMDLERLRPLYQGAGLLIFALALFLSLKRTDTEAALLAGFSAFLLLFNTVEYYFGMIGMLPFIWLRGPRRRFLLIYAALFSAMAFTYSVYFLTGSLMICHNYLLTAILLLFLAFSYALICYEQRRFRGVGIKKLSAGDRFPGLKVGVPAAGRRWDEPRMLALLGLAALIATLAFTGPFSALSPAEDREAGLLSPGERKPQGLLVFGGDVMLGRRQHLVTAERGPEDALGRIPLLAEADLSVVNLECVVARGGELGVDKGEMGPYYFRARPEMLAILEAAGIDVVITANNHSGDYGPRALLEQLGYLEAMNIGYAGSGSSLELAAAPLLRRVGQVNVAIFGLDTTQASFAAAENRPGNFYIALEDQAMLHSFLKPRIEEARRQADLVIVAVHWGPNFEDTPRADKVSFGRALVDVGADAVLGSSAHVLQGVDVYRGRPIIHDAGNLLFDFSETVASGLFALLLEPEGVREVRFHPLEGSTGYTRVPAAGRKKEISAKFIALSKALGTKFSLQDDGTAVLQLTGLPGREGPASSAEVPGPDVGAAPLPADDPPPGCTVRHAEIPGHALLDPVRFGPLELVGFEVNPQQITKREMLYFRTYWRLAEGVEKAPPGLLLQMRAEPAGGGRIWSGAHEPCDWQWPTDRFVPGVIYCDHYGVRPPQRSEIEEGTLKLTASVLAMTGDLVGERVVLKEIPVRLGGK